jgi:septal ring factor EnvC (AmiA/AmiB activator)
MRWAAVRPHHSLWSALVGAVVAVVAAGALVTQLPTALKHGDRAREVVHLQQQVATVRSQTSRANSDGNSLQSEIDSQLAASKDVASQVADQEKEATKLERSVRALQKEIRSLTG